jgi:hypothetical protein
MPTKLELKLRRDLKSRMGGHWLLTWHEDKEISPGVPDASYVMLSSSTIPATKPGFETGWLELKACEEPKGDASLNFQIEPSQHQWIGAHSGRVPIHFLVAVGEMWFFIHARHHQALAGKPKLSKLIEIADSMFPGRMVLQYKEIFAKATYRGRNDI